MNKVLTCTLLSILTTNAYAAIELGNHFSFSGFGSTSWAQSDNETPIFINRRISDESCFDCDTTFGLQLDFFYNALSASVQVVKRPQDDWSDPKLEWAYLGYQLGSVDFRAGRLRLPVFLASEYYYVGQAYPYARPPAEVYNSIVGVTAFNGVSLDWKSDVSDEMTLNIKPFYAFEDTNAVDFAPDFTIEFKTIKMFGANVQLTGEKFRLNATYLNSKYGQSFNGSPSIEDKIILWSLGGEYDWGASTWAAEAQTNDINSSSWYASVRYRLGTFTPYVLYGEEYNIKDEKTEDSYSVGVRYDLPYNISINAEWQYFELDRGFGQYYINRRLPITESDTNIYTVMLNFVF